VPGGFSSSLRRIGEILGSTKGKTASSTQNHLEKSEAVKILGVTFDSTWPDHDAPTTSRRTPSLAYYVEDVSALFNLQFAAC